MTITQLFLNLAITFGILLYAALAIVPLWVDWASERRDRPAH
ncbi:hypothetical protein ACQBAT_14810 [Ornithinimicrobium sp. Y1847]